MGIIRLSIMQCGPVQYNMSARTMTETTLFEHRVTPRYTEFRMAPELTEITIQDIYAALVDNAPRNEMIVGDMVRAVESGRCPLLLTGRTLQQYVGRLHRLHTDKRFVQVDDYVIEQEATPPCQPAAAHP